MITHCADHAWLYVVGDHVIRKTADVQFGVMMTARIAAIDGIIRMRRVERQLELLTAH
jgi:hypothetical protein